MLNHEWNPKEEKSYPIIIPRVAPPLVETTLNPQVEITRVGLVSFFLKTINIIQVSSMRNFHFLIPIGHGYLTIFLFSIPFWSMYHARTFMPRPITLVSIRFRMGLTRIITRVYKRFSHLDILAIYQYMTTPIIPISACDTNARNMHYFDKSKISKAGIFTKWC